MCFQVIYSSTASLNGTTFTPAGNSAPANAYSLLHLLTGYRVSLPPSLSFLLPAGTTNSFHRPPAQWPVLRLSAYAYSLTPQKSVLANLLEEKLVLHTLRDIESHFDIPHPSKYLSSITAAAVESRFFRFALFFCGRVWFGFPFERMSSASWEE